MSCKAKKKVSIKIDVFSEKIYPCDDEGKIFALKTCQIITFMNMLALRTESKYLTVVSIYTLPIRTKSSQICIRRTEGVRKCVFKQPRQVRVF